MSLFPTLTITLYIILPNMILTILTTLTITTKNSNFSIFQKFYLKKKKKKLLNFPKTFSNITILKLIKTQLIIPIKKTYYNNYNN